jgi:hypothetical protein
VTLTCVVWVGTTHSAGKSAPVSGDGKVLEEFSNGRLIRARVLSLGSAKKSSGAALLLVTAMLNWLETPWGSVVAVLSGSGGEGGAAAADAPAVRLMLPV